MEVTCHPRLGGAIKEGGGHWNQTHFFFYESNLILPEEIVERITSSVDFSHHLVKVSTEFVYTDLLSCRYEYAWSVFLCDPAVLELLQSVIFLLFRLKRELIVLFISICIDLVENDENRLIYGLYILKSFLYHADMIFEIRV